MKFNFLLLATVLVSFASAAETPKIFAGLLEKGVSVRGQVGIILSPPEIDKYLAKVEAAAELDPTWFREFSGQSKPGIPLPYHEKMGLTKEEYDAYLKLWGKREFKAIEEVMLLLRESLGGSWTISATGQASAISTIRYFEKEDEFRSPNGSLKRIDDIKADADSILGAWTGSEWKLDEETTLGKTKENLALGRLDGNKFGILVYHFLEVSSEGTRMVDRSILIRFALGAAGHLKPPADKAPAKPATKR